MNFYAFLADFVVFIHLCYMGYIVLGQLLILVGWPLGWQWIRNPWFRLSHLGLILIVVLEALGGVHCPLTTWEHDLRELAGQEYIGGTERFRDMSFTGRLLSKIQFAGNNYEEHINKTFYVAGGIIAATVVLVPPRFRRRQVAPPLAAPPEVPTTTSTVTQTTPAPVDPTPRT